MDERTQSSSGDRAPRPVLKFPTNARTADTTAAPPSLAPHADGGEAALRELVAVREIAHAFLTADRPRRKLL